MVRIIGSEVKTGNPTAAPAMSERFKKTLNRCTSEVSEIGIRDSFDSVELSANKIVELRARIKNQKTAKEDRIESEFIISIENANLVPSLHVH